MAKGRRLKHTQEEVLEAAKGSFGIILKVAKTLRCDASTVCRYRDRWPRVRDALAAGREAAVDVLEARLFDHVAKGNLIATIFALKCLGKSRGWVERSELTGPDGQPVLSLTDRLRQFSELERQDRGRLYRLRRAAAALAAPGPKEEQEATNEPSNM